MSPVFAVAVSVAVFVSAVWLTGRFRRYAIAQQLLDVPNVRSSHVVATPRGGGVAIVVTTVGGLLVLGITSALDWSNVFGFTGGGILVAFTGFVDDRVHIARRWRLLGHFIAAAWVLVWFGGLPPLPLWGFVLELGWLGHGLAAIYVVWLLNLTNFMDGIDGIAGIETITVCLGGILLYAVAAPGATAWLAPLVLAVATAGFLVWNWPPAKIFLGDAGSGFLGLMLAALSLQAARLAPDLFWGWIVLLGVFVVDATVTLIGRVTQGEKLYEAHRSHAYQYAARRWTHQPVTLAVGAINLFWLLPAALLVARDSLDGALGVVVAYLPLVTTVIWLRIEGKQLVMGQLGGRDSESELKHR